MTRQSALRDVKLNVVTEIDDLFELKRWLGERRETPLGLDTESGGLSPYRDRLRLVQIGDLHQGWAIPFPHWWGAITEVLSQYRGEFVMHNGSYDARVLKFHTGWQVPWERTHDTLTLAAIVDPGRPKGLKELSARLVDPTAAAGQQMLHEGMEKNKWTWDTVPYDFPPYWVYSALDPVLTCHMWTKLYPQVAAVPEWMEVYDLELNTLRIVSAMMNKGMRVDVDYIHEKRPAIAEFSARTRAWLEAAHQVTSPLSAGQIARAFTALGEPIHAYTKTGQPQMDKDALDGYAASGLTPGSRELARYIKAVRHADKMIGTYLDNFLERIDAQHILRCQINPMAAKTSRMSISDPSLQNLPRDDKVIRGAFAPHEGNVFITCDADQIECRAAAHMSNDEGLIQAFIDAEQPGAPDFFSLLARDLYRDPDITKKDPRRGLTKTYVYATQYGSGLQRLARTSGVPLDQVEQMDKLYKGRYPGPSLMMKQIINQAKAQVRAGEIPTVKTMMGRRLAGMKDSEYALFNYAVQGSSAEILKRGMSDLDAIGLLDYMIIPIHDEILFEVPRAMAADVLRTVETTLTDRTSYRVPITWSGDILPERWQKV